MFHKLLAYNQNFEKTFSFQYNLWGIDKLWLCMQSFVDYKIWYSEYIFICQREHLAFFNTMKLKNKTIGATYVLAVK